MRKIKALVTKGLVAAQLFCITAMANMNVALADTIWDKNATVATQFLENLTKAYRQWFPVLGLVGLVAYFFTKDQRAKEIEKKVLFGSVIVYVCCSTEVQTVITSTLDWITNLFA